MSDKQTKTFPVFDCDAHINDPLEIWDKYVEPEYRELVKQSYWNTPGTAILNGRELVTGGHDVPLDAITINGITIGGPGADKRVQRRLMRMRLTPEQCHYLDHRGAYDANARLKELDIMGIDQVLVIPTMMVNYFPFIENVDGAYALARAYNNWARDWCNTAPDRLYPAALIPIQNPDYAVEELRRVAKLNFPVALVRPIDANGHYPNRIFWASEKMGNDGYRSLDPFFRRRSGNRHRPGNAYFSRAHRNRAGPSLVTRRIDREGRRGHGKAGGQLDLQLHFRGDDLDRTGPALGFS